jgi:hypothetical protein
MRHHCLTLLGGTPRHSSVVRQAIREPAGLLLLCSKWTLCAVARRVFPNHRHGMIMRGGWTAVQASHKCGTIEAVGVVAEVVVLVEAICLPWRRGGDLDAWGRIWPPTVDQCIR